MTPLFASDDEHKKSHTHIYKNLDYLNLTITQKQKIKQILIECKKEFSKYYEEKQKANKKLQKLMQKERFDEEKYEDISEDIAEEAIELEVKIFKHIHAVLTPQQREQFSYHLKEWKIE
jgi:Spy/CpxP family protein refolding chaperone